MKAPLLFFKILLALLFLTNTLLVQAQGLEYGEVDYSAFEMDKYDKDTNAVAVVLYETGTTRMDNRDGTKVIFRYHVKIKVFNSQKFTHGDVVIPLYKEDNYTFENARDIKGVVFNKDEYGNIEKTDLDKKNIFKENNSKYVDLVKFALPNIKDGSVVEYAYELESPFIFNFRSWKFQWDIPKVYSEYIAIIPALYNYNVSLIGPRKLDNSGASLMRECFQGGNGLKVDCSRMSYVMNDIPAFIEEDFMTSPKNYISTIKFELSEISLLNGSKRKITKEWKDIDQQLKKHVDFGKQVRRDDLFKSQLPSITAGATNDLEKAHAVYKHIKGLFKWNKFYGKYSDEGIKKALEKRTGNVADINLSLVAALSAAGLQADAVILSTRDNGLINKLYPVMSDFNYVIAKLDIGGTSYFLDATDPLLPFGLLPLRCINDQGRVMSIDKPSEWIDLKASQKRSSVYSLNLALRDDGKIAGSVHHYSLGYEAFNKRKKIKEFNSIDEYVEDMDERMPKIRILSHAIQNLDSLQSPLGEIYEVELDAFDELDKERFHFNPFFMDRMDENPFKLAERSYPVDLGAPSDSRVVLVMSFPEEYEIVSMPESKGIGLPNKGGQYISKIDLASNSIHFSESTQLERSIYHPEEYHFLKELFNQIILVKKTDIIFKKKL